MIALALLAAAVVVELAAVPYLPPDAKDVSNYFPGEMPRTFLEGKSLRELAILRNTIYARYGWDGFRKQWLHDYFHAQKWFKPNPRFSYKLISQTDRHNAHAIASKEASFSEEDLRAMRNEIYARHGKVWDDKYHWVWKNGETTTACQQPKGYDGDSYPNGLDTSWDCLFESKAWYKPNPRFSEADLTPDERIEMGLLGRLQGEFATDEGNRYEAEESLDQLLALADLRKLSLRDLRLLRNTIYARRGRPFKSAVLREHFAGMHWYKENAAYTDKLLSDTDRRNVRLIHSVEEELGGALRDEDWLIEPALDGA